MSLLKLTPLLIMATSAAAAPAWSQAASNAGPAGDPARLETPTGTVHGTLLMPPGDGPFPVALIIAGSGPTDRDGNSLALQGSNNSLKLLAEGLAASSIASLRYDKRGVGESLEAGPAEVDLRFDTYVDDAAAWIRQLAADPRFSTVTVVGHSEGSLIGMIAGLATDANAFVSMAGIARPAPDIIRDQIRPQLPPDLWVESERILGALEKGETADSVPQSLYMLYRPSVQPYLISWFAHDPAARIAELTIPILITQGTTDIQVGVGEAEALRAAAPSSEILIIEGMNHILKAVPADMTQQMDSYSNPELPIAPELVDGIASFIHVVNAQP